MVTLRSKLSWFALFLILLIGMSFVAALPAAANHPACGYVIVIIDNDPYPVPVPECYPAHCSPGINIGPASEGGWPVEVQFFVCLNP